jgi:hypothetical protein
VKGMIAGKLSSVGHDFLANGTFVLLITVLIKDYQGVIVIDVFEEISELFELVNLLIQLDD